MNPPQPALEARSVAKRFAGVVALDGVSIQLVHGEVQALVGENGAGKSTLIKLLTGVYPPDAGEVRHRGEQVSFSGPVDAWKAGISTTYQEINLVPQLSVARNLFLGREPRTRFGLIDVGRINDEAATLTQRFDVDVDVRRPVGELGVGVRQMVAIVRAVSHDAHVVILDEPTSSLEPREVDRLLDVVARLRDQGVALLYVTHKLDEVFRLCDRVTVLRDGRMVHHGDVRDISRLELVATMLGRELTEVADGVTSFGEDHRAGTGTPVLEASGLTRRQMLHDVSVNIHEGEVVGLAGLLGSGRSETAKAIFGAQAIDSGSVTLHGEELGSPSPSAATRAGIALLPEDRQSEGLVPTLSVKENIALSALPALTRGGFVSSARLDAMVSRFMTQLQIKASSPDQLVSELSGGNQQKVLLARLLCLEPSVLILDEPTRGIDVGAKAEVQVLVSDLAAKGLAVLLISSELEEVVEGSDRVLVLKEGRVLGRLAGAEITEARIMALIASEGLMASEAPGENGDG